jgi:DNA-binding GntR family transcriptional regulator
MASDDRNARPDPLGERVYLGVKTYVMTAARPGQRLDMTFLADRQLASLTPVRAALHRLTGEGLVEPHFNAGFRVPPLSFGGLRDLYEWNRQLLAWAAQDALERPGRATPYRPPRKVSVVDEVARLFRALIAQLDNVEAEAAMDGLNDRLHRVRLFEASVLGDGVEEFRQIAGLVRDGQARPWSDAIEAYHQRRLAAVADIVSVADRRL